MTNTERIERVDNHYAQCLKAVCAVQGIACREMSGKAIFEEFGKLLAKEQENRELLKLG